MCLCEKLFKKNVMTRIRVNVYLKMQLENESEREIWLQKVSLSFFYVKFDNKVQLSESINTSKPLFG